MVEKNNKKKKKNINESAIVSIHTPIRIEFELV